MIGGRPTYLLLALLWPLAAPALEADDISGCGDTPGNTRSAGPEDYRSILPDLQPGDHLQLSPGTYTEGLPLSGTQGSAGNCIVVEGPANGDPAIFTGRSCCNTVSLRDVAYLKIRNLTLDGQNRFVDAVKLEGDSDYGHHVVLENLTIIGHGVDQQAVGISTKAPAWNWVIRHNTIVGAGTGMYLGDSDGSAEFYNGLIEYNWVTDTTGYNLQIKSQNGRTIGPDNDPGRTVIRHNCFEKENGSGRDPDLFRPNVLVGHWPPSGAGSEDNYLIYGNVFHHNDTGLEGLLQATGNAVIHDNRFFNPNGPALLIQPHEGGYPRHIRVFHNTVVAMAEGIRLLEPEAGFTQEITANEVFADPAISGDLDGVTVADNTTDSYENADQYLEDLPPPPSCATLLSEVFRDDFEQRSGNAG